MSTFHPAQNTSSLTEESSCIWRRPACRPVFGFCLKKHLIFSAVPDHSFLKIMICKGPRTISQSPLDSRVVSLANSSSNLSSANSFSMIRNSSSPRMDPCSTFYSTPRLPDTAPFTDTTWHLQLRYVESICRTSPSIPYLHILSSSSLWEITYLKSFHVKPQIVSAKKSLISKPSRILPRKTRRAVVVERHLLKACWLHNTWTFMTDWRTLATVGIMAIARY